MSYLSIIFDGTFHDIYDVSGGFLCKKHLYLAAQELFTWAETNLITEKELPGVVSFLTNHFVLADNLFFLYVIFANIARNQDNLIKLHPYLKDQILNIIHPSFGEDSGKNSLLQFIEFVFRQENIDHVALLKKYYCGE